MIICRILDLSFNRLRKIQNIDHLVKLRKLYLCDNKISRIENISTLTELVSLELGANRIRVSQSSSHLSHVHSHDMRYTMCIGKEFFNIQWWSHITCCLQQLIGHVNVQNCLLIIFQYQPITLQYSWLSVEQPIGFWLSDFFNTWEFFCGFHLYHWSHRSSVPSGEVWETQNCMVLYWTCTCICEVCL